uniref:Uncharacterized protein n=1 Tax=Odontella aurita TaxID=265563 RepID=A0A6U6H3C5_9STRA|mmetsp:Transcript_45588/g.138533  ORF Transcript_45588/g.138533 Transcript_45588/m.138533 type:complete len:200 (+) Transcript_45588:269-868(+)
MCGNVVVRSMLSFDCRQNIFNIAIVSHLSIVMLEQKRRAPEHEGAPLPQCIIDCWRSELLYANIVRCILVRLSEEGQRLLVVPGHHGVDGRGVPHGLEALLETEGVASSASLVAKAGRRVNFQLGGELGSGLAASDADEEDLSTLLLNSWDDTLLQLFSVLPAQKSSVVSQKRAHGEVISDTERSILPPERRKLNTLSV